MNPSTLAHPGRPSTALTADDLKRHAPSIYANHARPGVSPRYSFVSTADVIDLLKDEGWEPVNAREQSVRLEDRRGFQMHEVRFARTIDLGSKAMMVGQTRPEMILQNAHDGTRAYRINAGLYRLVCRNGLTVADTAFAQVSLRHVDVSPEKFAGAARAIAENTPHVMAVIARWQAIKLTDASRQELARRASVLRWDAAQPAGQLVSPTKLLTPKRHGDSATDLWTTFNVIQEHLVRGGDRYAGYVAMGTEQRFVRNSTRPVAGINEGQKLNKALWNLAEEFSRN